MTNEDFRPSERPAPRIDTAQPTVVPPARITHKTAWTLGLLGLIPFVLMAVIFAYAGRFFIAYPMLVLAFSGYSATILAFLGGIRWGLGMASRAHRRRLLILSVLPSLGGWILLFAPSPWVFAGFALAFALQGAWDLLAARQRELPAWFGRLRLVLTTVVVLCQIVAFAATY
ncbi:MAG TPA: DUF3429 domain-containing protein [Aurantimonas sp.]